MSENIPSIRSSINETTPQVQGESENIEGNSHTPTAPKESSDEVIAHTLSDTSPQQLEYESILRQITAELGSVARLSDLQRYVNTINDDMARLAAVVRDRCSVRMELLEKHEAKEQRGELEDIFDERDRPAAYEAVADRVEKGELTWEEIVSGRTDDIEARAIHMWLEPYLAATGRACQMIGEGQAESIEEALQDAWAQIQTD